MKKEAEIKIAASASKGFLFEKYDYSPTFFKDFLIADKQLAARRFALFETYETTLARKIKRLDFLIYLIENFAQNKTAVQAHCRHPSSIKVAGEYLDAHFSRRAILAFEEVRR